MLFYEIKTIQETIDKIALIADEKSRTIDIDLSVANENSNINSTLKDLENAIENKKIVQFVYTNNDNDTKSILVEPVGVIYKWYNWYFIGYSMKHKDYRMYKLIRMDDLVITDQIISKQHSLDQVMNAWEDKQENIKITAIGQACIKAKCREYLNDEENDYEIKNRSL